MDDRRDGNRLGGKLEGVMDFAKDFIHAFFVGMAKGEDFAFFDAVPHFLLKKDARGHIDGVAHLLPPGA